MVGGGFSSGVESCSVVRLGVVSFLGEGSFAGFSVRSFSFGCLLCCVRGWRNK